jgi:hypothetical protein
MDTQGAEMARTKKAGPREPNGRLSRAKGEQPVHLVRAMVAGGKVSGLWLQPLGIMCLNERITQAQLDAGQKYAQQYEAWAIATDAPPRNARAQDVNRAVGRSGKPEDARLCLQARDAYAKAVVAIGGYSSPQQKALMRIAVDLLNPDDYQQYLDLLDALNRLVRHYGGRG